MRLAEGRQVTLLPPRHLPRYGAEPALLARFYHCLAAVTWRLAQPSWLPLSCMAEQLALRGITNQAETLLEQRLPARRIDPPGWEARDAPLYVPGTDDDIAVLFDERFGGVDQLAADLHLGMASLQVEDWFTPFDEASC